jgi:hypothetical protein
MKAITIFRYLDELDCFVVSRNTDASPIIAGSPSRARWSGAQRAPGGSSRSTMTTASTGSTNGSRRLRQKRCEEAAVVHKTESAWESNPPAKLVTPPTGFEDQDSHRATSALVADCSPGRSRCQIVRYINLPSGPRSRFKSSSVSPKTSFSSSMRSSRRINARPSRSISSSLTVPCSTLCSAWRSIN